MLSLRFFQRQLSYIASTRLRRVPRNDVYYDAISSLPRSLVTNLERIETDKRVLLSYVTEPLRLASTWQAYKQPFNRCAVLYSQILALTRLGYVVDVAHYMNANVTVDSRYNLFIGHGGHSFQAIRCRLPAHARVIYYSTGSYWRWGNEQELHRLNAVYSRRGVRFRPDRLVTESEDEALEAADGIVALGNKAMAETYNRYPKIRVLPNATESNDRLEIIVKPKNTRRSILFFAGGGNIHKGLDLAVEASRGLEMNLVVCTYVESSFLREYFIELQASNVQLESHVNPMSPGFKRTMTECSYVLSLSCSEGSAGSVIECMAHGLIPIQTTSTHVDEWGLGFLLPVHPTVEEVRDSLRRAIELSESDRRQRADAIRENARREYSVRSYEANFQDVVSGIVSER
jgi:hypothetical protein